MSKSLVDVDSRIDSGDLTLDKRITDTSNIIFDRINQLIAGEITYDSYGRERITGLTDWHLRLEYYEINPDDTITDIINGNTLLQYIDKSYIHHEYIHLETIAGNGYFTFNGKSIEKKNDIDDNVSLIDTYLVKISLNILMKEDVFLHTRYLDSAHLIHLYHF